MATRQVIARTIALVFSTSLLFAQQPWEEPFHNDQAALLSAVEALGPVSGDHFADGIYQHTLLRWEADRRRTITQRTVYKVVNAAIGADILRAAGAWAPWFQNTPVIKARVITPDGRERWLDPKTLSEQAAPAILRGAYEGLRNLVGPLPGLADGALVEIEVQTRDRRPLLDSPITQSTPIVDVMPSRRIVVEIDAPADFDLQWKPRSLPDLQVEESAEGRRRRVRFTVNDVEAFGANPWARLASGGLYGLPTLSFSTGGAWNEVAAAYHRLVEKQLDGKPVPGDWPAADEDRLTTITSLAKQVHEKVRYEALLLGQASIQPRRPAETLERGYGDCKDKALLLKALLAEAGIESRLALVNAAAADDIDPDLPGFGTFNHAILYLPGEQPLWIDATAEFTPIGELPALVQGRWALIVDDAAIGLIKAPASTSTDNRYSQRIEQIYQADGSIVTRTQQVFHGVLAEAPRERQHHSPDAAEDLLHRLGGGGGLQQELDLIEADDPRSLESPYTVRLELSAKPKGARYSQDFLAAAHESAPALASLGFAAWVSPGDDAAPAPLKLPFAYQAELETRIVPPPGYKLRKLPISERHELGPAIFETTWSVDEDGAVVARTTFDTVVRDLDPDQAAAFREGLRRINQQKPETIYLDNAVAVGIRTGALKAALEAAQAAVGSAPDDLFAGTRMVEALMAVGAGTKAREEARRLVEAFPEEAAAYMALGEALLRGSLGQRIGPRDLDRDGAIAAFYKALELDPIARTPVARLVDAHSFAPDGSRYAPQSLMAEAVDLIQRELENENTSDRAKPELYRERAMMLGYSERYEELAAAVDGETRYPLISYAMKAAAVLHGVDAALSIAGGIEQEHQRLTAIDNTAGTLYFMRQYPQSKALYEAASQAAEAMVPRHTSAKRLESRARSAAILRRHDDLRSELKGPAVVVHDWMLLPYRDSWREDLVRLSGSSCGVLEIRNPKAGADFERGALTARHAMGSAGLWIDHAADWTVSFTETDIQGDDETGYWVRGYSTSGAPAARPWMAAFVELQDGEFKILDAASSVQPSLADLGCTLTKRLERDGLESVQVWLDRIAQTDLHGLDGFQTFWCEQCPNSPADARVALALLQSSDREFSADVTSVLEQAYLEEEGLDRKSAVALGWAAALRTAGAIDEEAALLTELADKHPLLTPVVGAAAGAQSRLGDDERALALLESGLAASPKHPDLIRRRAALAMEQGDMAETQRALTELEATSQSRASDYNGVAWTAVVAGEAAPAALAAIRKGLALAPNSPYLLNTEAALQALDGNPDRARALLYQAVFRAHAPEPSEGDYFVAGLILEKFGLLDEARRNFERAASGPSDNPAAAAALAAKALERLDSR